MTFTEVFGGTTIYPAGVSYRAVSLSADQTLSWPTETATNSNVVSQIMDVTPSAGSLSIIMPPANEASVGETTLFFNAGSFAFIVKDNGGNTIVSIPAGLSYQVYLIGNSTVNGTWRSTQYAAGTSSATAGSLVGAGIKAIGTSLNQSMAVTTLNTNYTIGDADRSEAFVWSGGAGTLTLPSATTVGSDWFCQIRNSGTGAISATPTGAQLINGAASLAFNPGDSAIIICDGSNFFTIGFGQSASFAFDYVSIDLTSQTSPYTLIGSNLNRIAYTFGGTLTSDMVVNIPPTIQQYWLSNETVGGFSITVKVAGQTGVIIGNGVRAICYCNGTDLVDADTSSFSFPVSVAQGGTGSTNASGARINLGGTSTGIALFTAASAADARNALGATTVGGNVFTLTNPSAITFPRFNADNTVSALAASAFRTAVGATTVGGNMFTLTNPSAITFPRFNADNTVSALDAATFRTAIGAGTSSTTGTVTSVGFTGGIVSVATATTTPALTIAGTSGGIPYFSSGTTWATSAALAANAIVVGGGAGAAPATVTTGTGVVTALGVAVGSAGAFVTFNGALGTPSSGTVTNLTGTASININGTVGATTASTGAFTTLSASSTVSGAGFSTYLASPPAIGGTAAAAGAFTTLSASSTVSGTGFSTYLASPPAIGGTAAAAGRFTTLALPSGSFTTTLQGSGSASASVTYTLPVAGPAVTGYVLSATTAGVMSWSAAAAGTVTSVGFTGGIVSVATATTTPALTIAGTSGGIPYFSSGTTWATSAALAANALVVGGGAGAAPATVTTGTGVVTALGVNTGSAGAFVVNGGALGTPSSGTLTSATGLPISTGVSGLGTGVATALAVNTGSAGAFVTFNGALGTPSSGTLTSATGLPISTGVSGLGTSVATALGVAVGSAGAFVTNGGALGTPSSGTLTNCTFPTLNQNTTGTASNVTGTVAVANGGTGATSITSGFLVKGNGTSALSASIIQDDGSSVGIGATPVGAKLDVSGLIRSRMSTATIDINHDGTNGSLASSSTLLLYANGANSILMHTNGVERFRITSTGGITSSDLVDAVGYKGLPQNARTASYTLALTDMGKHISITTGGVVVPANASVAFPIGSTVIVYNDSASSQNITITTDTMYLAGTATTGTRALAQRGLATLVKVAATTWVASGAGLT